MARTFTDGHIKEGQGAVGDLMACVSTKPVFGEAEMGNGLERAMAERRKWSKIVGSGVFGGRPGLCTMLKTIPKTEDAGDSVGDQESHKTQVERSGGCRSCGKSRRIWGFTQSGHY